MASSSGPKRMGSPRRGVSFGGRRTVAPKPDGSKGARPTKRRVGPPRGRGVPKRVGRGGPKSY